MKSLNKMMSFTTHFSNIETSDLKFFGIIENNELDCLLKNKSKFIKWAMNNDIYSREKHELSQREVKSRGKRIILGYSFLDDNYAYSVNADIIEEIFKYMAFAAEKTCEYETTLKDLDYKLSVLFEEGERKKVISETLQKNNPNHCLLNTRFNNTEGKWEPIFSSDFSDLDPSTYYQFLTGNLIPEESHELFTSHYSSFLEDYIVIQLNNFCQETIKQQFKAKSSLPVIQNPLDSFSFTYILSELGFLTLLEDDFNLSNLQISKIFSLLTGIHHDTYRKQMKRLEKDNRKMGPNYIAKKEKIDKELKELLGGSLGNPN